MPSAYGRDWKAVNIPYAEVSQLSGATLRRYELSDRTVGIILSQLAYAHWHTRWHGVMDFTEAQKVQIRQWAQQAEGELFALCTVDRRQTYPPNDPKITYAPNDPFLTPELIPDGGYVLPPWYTNPAIPLPGVEPSDAMVNFLGLPFIADLPNIDLAGLIAAGLPRFRVNNLSDGQTVSLHFVSIPQGGQAIITIDGGITYVNVVELNSDLTTLPLPETPGEQIENITISGAGAHFIDVTFIPIIDNEAGLPVFFGGGLRKVTIEETLTDASEESMPFDVRQNEELPCILEKTEDGIDWEQWADLSLCSSAPAISETPNGGIMLDDGTGILTPPPLASETYDPRDNPPRVRIGTDAELKCLASANAANVFWKLTEEGIVEVKRYWGLSVLALIGLILGGVFGGVWGVLILPLAGATTAVLVLSSLTTGVYTSAVFRDFACILLTNASVNAGVVTFNFSAVQAGVVAKQATFGFNVWHAIYAFLDIVGEGGLNLAGETDAITDACCDYCSTGTNTTYLPLGDNPWKGVMVAKNANNANTVVKDASGLRVNANGNTLYARWDWAYSPPPGTEIVTFGFYMTNAGEPFSGSLFLNNVVVKTWTNHRPFGNFHYVQNMTLLPGVNTFILSLYNNNTTTGYFRVEQLYAVYKGCDPFAAYR